MTNFAEKYLDKGLVYDFDLTPADVPSIAAAHERGINCTLLARFVIEDLYEYKLPEHLLCTEMFFDNEHLVRSDAVEAGTLQAGDLVWFGRAASKESVDQFQPQYDTTGQLTNWRQLAINHVGVATGNFTGGSPAILHAVERENVTVWPIDRFKTIPRYSVIWGVSRLKIATVTD